MLKDAKTRTVQGLITCYVDDLLVSASRAERDAFLQHLRTVWACSEASHAETSVVKYCGLEIKQTTAGLEVNQAQYVSELLLRHAEIEGVAPTPCSSWKESYDDGETRDSVLDPGLVKQAQSLTGELLWLVVRARPDIAFPISRMAQLSSRRPQDALDIGYGVLKYLRGSVSVGLLFGPMSAEMSLSHAERFAKPLKEESLQAFSDASFGPASGRSHQGLVVTWAGCPLHWESSRQTLVSLSTAEAELVAMVNCAQASEAIGSLLTEILDRPLERQLYGDNAAAISIVSGPPTSWRTRHLRLRASALREKMDQGLWSIHHLAGEFLCADLLTKSLPVQRFAALLPLIGTYDAEEPKVAKLRCARTKSSVREVGIALLALCAPQFLKGAAMVPDNHSFGDEMSWIWIVGMIMGVILLWEAAKSVSRPCLRALVAQPVVNPTPVDVRVSVGNVSVPATEFRGRETASGSSDTQVQASVAQTPSAVAPPPPQMPQSPQHAASLRIPHNLTAHFTASGERWHQNPDCADIRGRIHSRFLPCGNCTVGRLPVLPARVPPAPAGTAVRQRRRLRGG